MDRASDYGSEGWEFKSLRARHTDGIDSLRGLIFGISRVVHFCQLLTMERIEKIFEFIVLIGYKAPPE